MLLEDVLEFLRQTPPFQFLDQDALNVVAGGISVEYYPKDSLILRQDGPPSDSLRLIKKGGVKVTARTPDGEEGVIDLRGEGENFGFLSLLGKERQRTTIRAVEDTICYLIGRDTILKLMESNPTFTEYFLKTHFSRYIHRTYSEMLGRNVLQGTGDLLLFTTTVGEIISREVTTVGPGATVREAAVVMSDNRASSAVVLDEADVPAGIVTDRDLRDRVVAAGLDPDQPVRRIMSPALIRVDSRDHCFDALLKMLKHNIHHLPVVRDGSLEGMVTDHDLMMLQGRSPLSFVRDIDSQVTVDGLVPVSRKINQLVGLLLKEGARAGSITCITTELNDRLVVRVLDLARRRMGAPPLPFAWIVFGSEGRKEQTFRTDQDNALVFADSPSPEVEQSAREWFSEYAAQVRDDLSRLGFPPCPAGYMASNPQWRQPLRTWKRLFVEWLSNPTPEALLRALTLFDFRPLYGDLSLGEELRDHLSSRVGGEAAFLGAMANQITRNRPPIGFFKSFVVEKGGEHKDELNLKVKGITPLVDVVRLFSLEKGLRETSTLERLAALMERNTIVREYGEELQQAFEFMTFLRFHHQLGQIDEGRAPDNFINPDRLSNLERKTIKDAFGLVSRVQDLVMERYRGSIW